MPEGTLDDPLGSAPPQDVSMSLDPPDPGVTAVGLSAGPHVFGKRFYVYSTHFASNGCGWKGTGLRRLTVTCP